MNVLDLVNHDMASPDVVNSHTAAVLISSLERENRLGMEKSSLPQSPGLKSIKVREAWRRKWRPEGSKSRCRCSIFNILPTVCQHCVKSLFLLFPVDTQVRLCHTDTLTHPAILHDLLAYPDVSFMTYFVTLSPQCVFVSLRAHPGLEKTWPWNSKIMTASGWGPSVRPLVNKTTWLLLWRGFFCG